MFEAVSRKSGEEIWHHLPEKHGNRSWVGTWLLFRPPAPVGSFEEAMAAVARVRQIPRFQSRMWRCRGWVFWVSFSQKCALVSLQWFQVILRLVYLWLYNSFRTFWIYCELSWEIWIPVIIYSSFPIVPQSPVVPPATRLCPVAGEPGPPGRDLGR